MAPSLAVSLVGVSSAGQSAVRLRPVDPPETPAALALALTVGPPVAPLPPDPRERAQALAMLEPERPLVESDAAAVVSTSGSTGRPKGVVLSRSAIAASAEATHERLGGPGDWVLALPAHYVAGLMVWARALLAGTSVRPARSDLEDLPTVANRLDQRRYVSLVPTQLTRALDDPRITTALATFSAVLVGGGPLEPGLRNRAERRGVPVIGTYGLSETCGGCVYEGRTLTGVGVQLDPDGRIGIAGPSLFSGYRLRPELTASAMVDGRLWTQDRGRWQGDVLRVLGRMDDVVISGGLNVDLAEVERLSRGWPALRGAELAVVGVSDGEWGTRVVAVTEAPATPDGRLADLRGFLATTLPAYAAPRELVRLDVLPRTSTGKIDRSALRSLSNT